MHNSGKSILPNLLIEMVRTTVVKSIVSAAGANEMGASDQPLTERKQIYTHESPWNLYSINFSNKPEKDLRLSLGSYIEDTVNKVEIIKLDEDKGEFQHCTYFDHEYPPSKIMWIPDVVIALNCDNFIDWSKQ